MAIARSQDCEMNHCFMSSSFWRHHHDWGHYHRDIIIMTSLLWYHQWHHLNNKWFHMIKINWLACKTYHGHWSLIQLYPLKAEFGINYHMYMYLLLICQNIWQKSKTVSCILHSMHCILQMIFYLEIYADWRI